MTPRAAAQRISQAAIDAMAAEWAKIEHEFEAEKREAYKEWVWDLAKAALRVIPQRMVRKPHWYEEPEGD